MTSSREWGSRSSGARTRSASATSSSAMVVMRCWPSISVSAATPAGEAEPVLHGDDGSREVRLLPERPQWRMSCPTAGGTALLPRSTAAGRPAPQSATLISLIRPIIAERLHPCHAPITRACQSAAPADRRGAHANYRRTGSLVEHPLGLGARGRKPTSESRVAGGGVRRDALGCSAASSGLPSASDASSTDARISRQPRWHRGAA